MGRKIDRAALLVVLVTALYLFFAAAFHSIWAAALCTVAAALLLRRALAGPLGRGGDRKRARAAARAALENWARLPQAEAEGRARALLAKAYPDEIEGAEFAAVLRHPDGAPLTVDAVLGAWRGRGGEKLIVAATAAAEPRTLAYAKTLENPRVRLIDAGQLTALLERFPPQDAAPPAKKRVWTLPISRERAPRRLLFGALLLAMYMLLGNILYLGAALATLTFAALGLRKRPVPKRLFE